MQTRAAVFLSLPLIVAAGDAEDRVMNEARQSAMYRAREQAGATTQKKMAVQDADLDCIHTDEFNPGYGDCTTYDVGGINHNFCQTDQHTIAGVIVYAYQACPGCGTCTAGSGPTPSTPSPPIGSEPVPEPGAPTEASLGSDDPSCSGGCAFLIIFFVGGFVYLAAGFAYNYRVRQLRGAEAVPHLIFFKDLPFMVKDGVVYSYQRVHAKVKGEDEYGNVPFASPSQQYTSPNQAVTSPARTV